MCSSDLVAATYAATGYPESNLANPSTVQKWKSTGTGTQYLTVTLGAAETINFIGLARHNFGSVGATLTVEADPGTGSWAGIAGPQIPGDDSPLMFCVDDTLATGVRLKIENATDIPECAVLSVGTALRMIKGLQPGHTPLALARTREMVNGAAQNGDYLGDIEIRSRRQGSVTFKALDADWYRTSVADFVEAARTPFFFAWLPASYPLECGYAWCTSDPMPVFGYFRADLCDLTLEMEGLAL